jgi:hypothetical protein
MLSHLLLSLPVLVGLSGQAGARELRTLPPDLAYCRELAARLASQPEAGREPAQSLGAEGIELCRQGYVRTGVAKLRRAVKAAQGR